MEKIEKILLKSFTYIISLLSFSSFPTDIALNNNVENLVLHIQKISKSNLKFKSLYDDLRYRSYKNSIKLVTLCPNLLLWCFRKLLRYHTPHYRNSVLATFNSLFVVENIELLSFLYEGLDYENAQNPISKSNLRLLDKIISQECPNNQKSANRGSFEEILTHRKCNFPNCKFEAAPFTKQNTNSNLTIIFFAPIFFHFIFNLIYFLSYILTFLVTLPSIYCTILHSLTLSASIFFAWELAEPLTECLVIILLRTIKCFSILGLDKNWSNYRLWKKEDKSCDFYSLNWLSIFYMFVLIMWIILTTFDIRQQDIKV
jgi:hypothetical protein